MPPPLQFTLFPFGSAGDVLPFIWLGRQLRQHGHRVQLLTSPVFAGAARAAGLPLTPVGSLEDFEHLIRDPRLWRLYQGTKLVFDTAGRSTAACVELLEREMAEGRRPDVLLAPCTMFGARLIREKHRLPLVTVDLQPAVMISAHAPPVLVPGMQMLRRLPLWLRRRLLHLPNPADRFAGTAVRAACLQHGVAPPDSLWWDWAHSPDGVLALFPDWFAAPQPDWPANLLQWDFPLEDLSREQTLPSDLKAFLAAGERPVVFTAGSANVQARRFFETALAAVTALQKRAVLVTRDRSQLPGHLPDSVLSVDYAPFSLLLPHAAAFVHHGGIGTLAQGLAAGVPQLVTALAHDQPDNARRVQQLGAGRALQAAACTPRRLAETLRRLLTDPHVAQVCRALARRTAPARSAGPLVDWLVAIAGRGASATKQAGPIPDSRRPAHTGPNPHRAG